MCVEKEFEAAKRKYDELRETERKELSKRLKKYIGNTQKSLELDVRDAGNAGKGSHHYTSGGRIKEYDLSNWKWVEVTGKGDYGSFSCVVSLNMHEVDPKTANIHALYDRIGLYITYQLKETYYSTEIYTAADLPLDDKEYAYIGRLILEQFEIFCKMMENMEERTEL